MSTCTMTASTTTGGTWSIWNTAASTSTADTVWYTWADCTTATTSATITVDCWPTWTTAQPQRQYTYVKPPPETEAQKVARLELAAEQARKYAEQERLRAEAAERALELLRENLNQEQRESLAKDKNFVVVTKKGNVYQINHGIAGNVQKLDEKRRAVEKLCIHPAVDVPAGDAMLAQKLCLENDEETFRKVANITNLRAA